MRWLDVYKNKNAWKFVLFLTAVLIGAGTLWYTETFLNVLRHEEQKSVQLWAQAVNIVNNPGVDSELLIVTSVLTQNTTIPRILTDEHNQIITYRSLDEKKVNDPGYLAETLEEMKSQHEPIIIQLPSGEVNYLYYQESTVLTQLRVYPAVLLGVVSLFIIVAYLAFSSARRAEQDRVWTGMAKETAHQIGTPLSSLMGWIEILRAQEVDEAILKEMSNDVDRLGMITDRFSKIGSMPNRKEMDIVAVTRETFDYLRARTSNKIDLQFEAPQGEILVELNKQLFSWVIENLVRNAIDAIEAPGFIRVEVGATPNAVRIDVEDSGKGMNAATQRAIFRPGFTTKSRGWGLGLSLAKRIIAEYHGGRIFVLKSEPGLGTTFRILIPTK